MPMNQAPTLDHRQWQTMLHWLPDELWNHVRPRVAIQNDVNGFPRAGAMALLDRDVQYLLMGINATNGGPPVKCPTAFWWQMPDSRRMFVWMGDDYAAGFYYFHPQTWRRGPVPESTDTRYRPRDAGDFFLRGRRVGTSRPPAPAPTTCPTRGGTVSSYPSLIVSVTNEWRIDNDPPFPPLANFVATWNRLELQPELHLSTAVGAGADATRDRQPHPCRPR